MLCNQKILNSWLNSLYHHLYRYSVRTCNNSTNYLLFFCRFYCIQANCTNCTLFRYWHYNIYIFCVVNAVDKWSIVFKNQLFSQKALLFAVLVAVALAALLLGALKSLAVNVFLSTIMFNNIASLKSDIWS